MVSTDVAAMEGHLDQATEEATHTLRDDDDEFGRTKEVVDWRKTDLTKLSPAQRNACYELFRRGDIDWLLHPEQKRLLRWVNDNPADLLTICISRQFGKSFMLVAYAIAVCLRTPGIQVLFVAPSKKQVAEIILPRISAVIGYLGEALVPARNALVWTFQNGSKFTIDGVNIGSGTRLRGGATPNLVIIDECRDVPLLQDVIESSILPMLSTTNGRIVLVSSPPESPLHSFTSKYIAEAKLNDSFYSATFRENALLSTKFIRRLMTQYKGGEDNPIFQREYCANFAVTDPEKRVVREWDEKDNDSWFTDYPGPRDDQNRPITVRPFTAMDYAHSDPCGLLFTYFDWHHGCLVVLDEHFRRGMNTDDVGKVIVQMEAETYGHLQAAEIERISDLNPTLMSDLRSRFGLKFRPCPKIPNDAQMLNRLRVRFVEGKIRVHKRCVQLRHQLQCGVFGVSGDYVRTDAGGHLDLIDALKYLNLSVNFNEVLHSGPARELAQNQIMIGANPFAVNGSFGSGVIQRPK